jgi:large subunit ribosomal protein L1
MAKKTASPAETPADAPASSSPAAPPSAPKAAAPTDSGAASSKKKKKPGVPPRRGKKLRNIVHSQHQRVMKDGAQPLPQAVKMLKQLKRAKFDETVEVHMWLGIDAKQSDQLVRGSVVLPHGLGKTKRVVVFCQGDNVAKAKEAGADFAGSADLIEKIQKENWLDFDVAIATQDMMGQVSRLGKTLGPRGLMPTPKAGTVVPAGGDISTTVREFKAGKVEYRNDNGGNVHVGVGKLSFDEQKLVDNVTAFIEQIRHVRPSAVKGHYIKSVTLSATMSPGIPLQL